MADYFSYYAESNIVCFVIFSVMLVHDLRSVDRQEKQIKYDHALIAFMLYFISDTLWAGVEFGAFPVTAFTVAATNFLNYVVLAAVTYMWLRYVMAVEKFPNRERLTNKLIVLSPFIISTIALIATYCFAPEVLIGSNLELQPAVYIFLVTVPYIYIFIVLVYGLRMAWRESDSTERWKHISLGCFPLLVIVGGLFEVFVMPTSPVFCFSSTVLMLIFYIQAMETRISIDPLTGLNNRGQLMRYVSQSSNMHREDRLTYVAMIDIDDFKTVNDTYGHAEGDTALTVIATALKDAVKDSGFPTFLCRFGGDEFVLIAHPASETELAPLVDDIRARIDSECVAQQLPFSISVSIGYDRLLDDDDTYQKCMQRADQKLYSDKEFRKS